jgi:Fe-S cluster assembly protein SufB
MLLFKNFSQCDSFLIGASSLACTYPYLDIWNSNSIVEHEKNLKISEEQLFYLMQRGIELNKQLVY